MGFGNREPLRAATDRPIENASSLIPTHPKLGVFEGNELRLPPACIRVCSCLQNQTQVLAVSAGLWEMIGCRSAPKGDHQSAGGLPLPR